MKTYLDAGTGGLLLKCGRLPQRHKGIEPATPVVVAAHCSGLAHQSHACGKWIGKGPMTIDNSFVMKMMARPAS